MSLTVWSLISLQELTTLLPWIEVKLRDVLALGVAIPSRPVQEGVFRDFSDTSVVTDYTSHWCLPQWLFLSLSEDAIILPPKSEMGQRLKCKDQIQQWGKYSPLSLSSVRFLFLLLTGLPDGSFGTELRSSRQTEVPLVLHGQTALTHLQATHQCCQGCHRDSAVSVPDLYCSALQPAPQEFVAPTVHRTCATCCSLKRIKHSLGQFIFYACSSEALND